MRERRVIVSLISLGCSKNTVDSEHILAHLVTHGLLIAEDPRDADVCLVNTCGFIEAAREETAAVLSELRANRNRNDKPKIVALGCLVQRARSFFPLRSYLAAADLCVGFEDYAQLAEICRSLAKMPKSSSKAGLHSDTVSPAAPQRPADSFLRFLETPRLRIGSPHIAYLKISEGCANACRYCSIPLIRGKQVSRAPNRILAEARQLIDSGAAEIDLIAQDTTAYGLDLGMQDGLAQLIQNLAEGNDRIWYRILYAHPARVSDRLLEVLSSHPCLCPYLDLPLQHVSTRILTQMGRNMTSSQIRRLLERIRERLPNAALRTTFIVGFPGETEDDFRELVKFIREGWFTHVGVFAFSPEPGTPAAELEDSSPPEEKEHRRATLMEVQREIRQMQLAKWKGHLLDIMIDTLISEPIEDLPPGTWAVGRTRFDAPEVDSVVFIQGPRQQLSPGSIVRVRATGHTDYDLIAVPDVSEI